jgi:hypothetical protein
MRDIGGQSFEGVSTMLIATINAVIGGTAPPLASQPAAGSTTPPAPNPPPPIPIDAPAIVPDFTTVSSAPSSTPPAKAAPSPTADEVRAWVPETRKAFYATSPIDRISGSARVSEPESAEPANTEAPEAA